MTATIDPYLQGKLPDYNDPVVLPKSHTTVEDFCNRLHKGIIKQFKYALVWGTSTKHRPQKVGKDHVLEDEDIVQLVSHSRGGACTATAHSKVLCNFCVSAVLQRKGRDCASFEQARAMYCHAWHRCQTTSTPDPLPFASGTSPGSLQPCQQ